jgi:hypothetical protein
MFVTQRKEEILTHTDFPFDTQKRKWKTKGKDEGSIKLHSSEKRNKNTSQMLVWMGLE